MLTLVLILLVFAAIYCGGMWAATFVLTRMRPPVSQYEHDRVELVTFHLGLCFILAVGFAGLILVFGGH